MAQLKDTTIQGSLSITGQLYAGTSSTDDTVTKGNAGQVLKSNGGNSGKNIYWGSIPTFNGAVDSSSTLFAPTSAGNEGQLLFSAGAGNAPTWDYAKLMGANGNRYARSGSSLPTGSYGIRGNSLEMLTTDNTWASIAVSSTTSSTANTSGTKTFASCDFLLHSPILYQKSADGVYSGTTNAYVEADGYLTAIVNLQSSTGATTSWTALTISQPIYLIGKPQDARTFKIVAISNKCWTQQLPSAYDGYIYIYLGVAINNTDIYLHSEHPIYWHNGQQIVNYTGVEVRYGLNEPDTEWDPTTNNLAPREGSIYYHLTSSASTIPTGGTTNQALIKASNNDYDMTWGSVGGIMEPTVDATKFYVTGSISSTTNSDHAVFHTQVYVQTGVLHGACWNDYAEYRETSEVIEPGRCIVENGDGTLSLSTQRMQPGAEIVSDTFGFAIGETDKCRTPIAVSGRVLAYGDKPANEFTIGAPVCAGENGTISEMTDDEARAYPWLIIGTVSAIPQEEYWGTGNIQIDGRIWIRVR